MELAIDRPAAAYNRYRIEIQKVYPVMPKEDLVLDDNNNILGVSLHAPASEGDKMLSICDFLKKRGLTTINLLMGDSLYRYTAMIKYRCSEQEGRELGVKECVRLQSMYSAYIEDNIQYPYQLKFFMTSEIERQQDFKIIYENIVKLFDTSPDFKSSVLNFAHYYFSRAFDAIPFECAETEIEYACKYLMEELAIFATLNQDGFNVFIYTGVIQTLYDIVAMNEPYLMNLFEKYTLISLRIKRKN
jgi:hypothetical protein